MTLAQTHQHVRLDPRERCEDIVNANNYAVRTNTITLKKKKTHHHQQQQQQQ